jgi:protein MpaA
MIVIALESLAHLLRGGGARDTEDVSSTLAVAGVDWESRLASWRVVMPTVLGTSRLGRPILGRLSTAGGHRAEATPARGWTLLVVGATHGDEPASAEAVGELAKRLEEERIEGRARPAAARVHIIPALNPDGLVAGTKNCASDVDLNRNFPSRNFVRAHAPGYDPGPFPLSEPESALLARLVDELGVDAVLSVHAPFACVNFDGPAEDWATAVAAACGWPVRPNIGYPTPGSLGSWLGVDREIPVLTLELPAGPLEAFRGAAAAALDAAVAWPHQGLPAANLENVKIP